jgi:hypothetical protein
MTWESVGKALMPSVQSAVYSLLTMIAGAAITYVLYGEKAPVAPPIAQRTVSVATVPVKTDQTKLQLVGLQHSLDQIAEVVREINSKDYCGPKPQRAAAKAK